MDTQVELKNSKDIITFLSNQFPNCFLIEGNVKPLKIGIFQDLAERLSSSEPVISKTRLRMALRLYTSSWRYLYSVKEGENRIDLDGNPAELVTSEQAQHAATQLKESKEKAKLKRQAENKDKPAKTTKELKPKTPRVKPETAKKVSTKKAPKKVDKVDVSTLKIGDNIKIVLGTKPVPAVISNIEKEHIKVKVSSGMELTVSAEHILV